MEQPGHSFGGCHADRNSGLAGFGCRSGYGEFDRRTEMAKRSPVPETGGLPVAAILAIEVEPLELPPCPRCGAISTSRHSDYIRTPAIFRSRAIPSCRGCMRVDGGVVRLLVCIGSLSAPLRLAYARRRRSRRLDNVAFLIGHALSGRPAEWLARRLGVPMSRDVILTNLRRAAWWNAESGPTRMIGIDEWSRRKGSNFGSIIVDLERRQAIGCEIVRTSNTSCATATACMPNG
jgi:hypothetical protein